MSAKRRNNNDGPECVEVEFESLEVDNEVVGKRAQAGPLAARHLGVALRALVLVVAVKQVTLRDRGERRPISTWD